LWSFSTYNLFKNNTVKYRKLHLCPQIAIGNAKLILFTCYLKSGVHRAVNVTKAVNELEVTTANHFHAELLVKYTA